MESVDEVLTKTDTPISDLMPTEEADPELVVHLRQAVTDLQREIEEVKQRHVDEIAFISDRLSEEADEHELCSVYDNVIAAINADPRITVPLVQREVEVAVRIRGAATFTFDRNISVNIPVGTHPNSDLARERALAAAQSLGLRWLAQSGTDMEMTLAPTVRDPF